MTRKNFVTISSALLLIVAVLVATFGQAPTASFAQEAKGGPVPFTSPGLPSGGESALSAAQLKSQALPQMDAAAINDLFNADLAKVTSALDKSGKFTENDKRSPKATVSAGLAAMEALKSSTTDRQRANIKAVVSKHTNALASLVAPVQAALQQAKDNPGQGISLADAKKLDADLQAWKISLDIDLARVMTRQQMKLYKASMADVPHLNVGNDPAPSFYTDNMYYAYLYAYYADYYAYYGYVYAYYGYYYGSYSYSYDYYAYLYSYYGYIYAGYAYYDTYYAYYYGGLIDAAYAWYDSYYAYLYEYYAYYYAYYAYLYLTDTYGYLYYSYYYNYYTQAYGYYAYYYSYYSLYDYVVSGLPY